MVTCSNILVVTILILVSNFNIGIWLVNGCSGRDFRCGPDGPPIRFPFRLKDKETEQSCGYNGFDLTCSDTHKTQIEFPSPSGAIILEVMKIIYPDNRLYLTDPENCLPRQFVKLLRSPISPFQFFESPGVGYNFTILHCSSSLCPVIVVDSSDTLFNSGLDPIDCTKTSDSDFTSSDFTSELVLTWSKPNCSKCEKEGKMCKLKNNGTEDGEIECFDRHHKPTKKILLYVTGEDETRIEKFLEDYRTLNPARFSYHDIKRITNNFREELGEGAHGAVFKGKLSNEILVAVKMLNNAEGDGKEFINEVKAMGKVHHINVVRLVGFCADGCYRALVYNFFPNGSLQNFITKPDDIDRFLGWEKLQQIALGIAK
ncbi:receptor-like protein kinase, partial [Trifolium pratense]